MFEVGNSLIEVSVFVEGNQDGCPVCDERCFAEDGLGVWEDVGDVCQQHEAILHVVQLGVPVLLGGESDELEGHVEVVT